MEVLESPKPRAASIINRTAHALLRAGTRRLNPLMLSLAGSRRLSMFAVVYHQGRRSGRSYATPVSRQIGSVTCKRLAGVRSGGKV